MRASFIAALIVATCAPLASIEAQTVLFAPSGTLGATTNPTSGNVGIGTSSPASRLHVLSSVEEIVRLDNYGTSSNGGYVTIFDLQGGTRGFLGYGPTLFSSLSISDFGVRSQGGLALAYGGGYVGAYLSSTGNMGIGTITPTHKLTVNGAVRAKEVIVETGWSDYVFDERYRLAPLSEVEQHIKAEKHLPGIPSAADVAEKGISLGEMQAKLLAKIEELTLHQIEQEKRWAQDHRELEALRDENARLREQIRSLAAPTQ